MSQDTEQPARGRGRPAGTPQAGSLTWLISKLEPGQCVLEPDTDDWKRRYIHKCVEQVRAMEPKWQIELKLCYGNVHGFDEVPFRFFRIGRVK